MKTFVESSAFYALADTSDQHDLVACQVCKELIRKEEPVTTDHVLLECWFLITHHLGRNAALKLWDFPLSGAVELVVVERKDLESARQIVAEYVDQDFSLVDGANFAVMERLNIKKAFAFDAHFAGLDRKNGKDSMKFSPAPLSKERFSLNQTNILATPNTDGDP